MRKMKSPFGFQTIGANRKGAIITAPVAPPTISGSLADVNTTQLAAGTVTANAAGVFVGSGITYTLTTAPAGVTINASTGVVTIARDAVLATSSVVVRGTNAGGFASAGFSVTVTSGVVVDSAAVTMMTSVTTMGATFTFAAPVAVVFDALGDPALVSTSAISITGITPLSAPVGPYTYTGSAGAVNTSGHSNGCVWNWYNTGAGQGIDPVLADDTAGGQSATENTYNAALNIDPAATGSPINIAVGQTGALTKAVRRTDVALPGPWRSFDSYAVLPIMASVPPVGFLLPAASDPDAIVEATEAQCRYDIYPNFAPITGMYTLAEAEARTLRIIPSANFGGEQLRRLNLEDTGAADRSNYAGDFGMTRAGAKLNLLVADTNANKRILHLRSIRNGLHHYANYKRGWRGGGGAGQHQGYLLDMLIAGFALGRTDIIEAFRQVKSNVNVQPGWVKPQDINKAASYPTQGNAGSDVRRYCAPYTARHIGEPIWRIGSQTVNTYASTEMNARYCPTSSPALTMEVMVMAELRNGPGGMDGLTALCDGPFNNTNDRAAPVHFADVYVSCTPNDYQDRQLPAFARTWYAARRATWPMAPYAGRPTQFDLGDTSSFVRITALAGGFSWNFANVNYSVLPITARNLRYGYDGRSWKYLMGVAPTGSVTGLLRGKKVYVQEQRVNAAGASEWSNNFAFSGARTERLFCTTTGTEANAAPVVDVAPRLVYKPAPGYKGPIYEDCPAQLTNDIVRVYVSDGVFTGFPLPTTTYEILVDGVVVSTADFYDFVPADLGGKPVTLRTTTTNGVGAPVVLTSAPVLTFSLVPDAADIVIQTDFGPDFKLRYPNVWASRIGSASVTIAHNGSESFVLAELAEGVEDLRPTTSPGCLRGVRNGSFPFHRYNFAADKPLVPGGTYTITVHFPIGFGEGLTTANQVWGSDGQYWIAKNSAPAVAADYIVPATTIARAGQQRIEIVSHTFVAGAGNTELWLRELVNSSSASVAGGTPIISHVTVQRIG